MSAILDSDVSSFPFSVSYDQSLSPSLSDSAQLGLALGAVKQQLVTFAQSETAIDSLSTTFKTAADHSSLNALLQDWSNGQFTNGPDLVVLPHEAMNGAQGAYSTQTNTIYLAESLAQQKMDLWCDPLVGVVGVVIEEMGHSIDALLHANGGDTLGDEGELFKAVVLDIPLSEAEKLRISQEDDRGMVLVDGEAIAVEQSTLYGDQGHNRSLKGTNEADEIYGYGGNDRLFGLDGDDYLDAYGDGDTANGGDRSREKDILVGGAGADQFILGNSTQTYYANNGGKDRDHAIIKDFNLDSDTIQLQKLSDDVDSASRAYGYVLEVSGKKTLLRRESDG
ncbi:MAG: hypothetical protein AB4042_05210, partial [Leptolyngbyaceae cyanobacterium]